MIPRFNEPIDNLFHVIMESDLDDLKMLICEQYDLRVVDYYDLLYKYITKSLNMNITYEEFYDEYCLALHEMYADCIIQQYARKRK